ncbi:uncharacterized protein LOC144095532 [Amblyomma americanum]
MLAYVKYEDKARAILPVNLIKLFEPESLDDFDPRKQVNAFWCSEDRSIFGYYPAFVHALADDLELMHSKLKSFRDSFPRVIDVDLQCSKEPVGKRRKMPSSKGKKKYRAEAVDLVNEAIVEQCGTELEPPPPPFGVRAKSGPDNSDLVHCIETAVLPGLRRCG